jgi:hypothetical protein
MHKRYVRFGTGVRRRPMLGRSPTGSSRRRVDVRKTLRSGADVVKSDETDSFGA